MSAARFETHRLMEAAALYAFSATSGHSIVCFAHVTNSMARTEGDFEKGEADGAKATLAVIGPGLAQLAVSAFSAGQSR